MDFFKLLSVLGSVKSLLGNLAKQPLESLPPLRPTLFGVKLEIKVGFASPYAESIDLAWPGIVAQVISAITTVSSDSNDFNFVEIRPSYKGVKASIKIRRIG